MQKYSVDKVRNYINGQFVESVNPEHVDITNPATGDRLGAVPLGATGDVERAVAAAKAAFKSWREVPVAQRARHLFELRNLMMKNYDELLAICTQEHGKTLDESKGDVFRGVENVETGCGMPSLMLGSSLEQLATGIDCMSVRQPMGVFAIIAPYNFPSMVPLWFLPYAVASGNTVVVKPSEQVPFSQLRLMELMHQAGFPTGVVNSVNGGRAIVNAILDHEDIAGVSFVGSSPVAEHVYQRCGATKKRCQALGGAKNFTTVMDDCDWDKSIANIIDSAFGCAGQRCLATAIVVGVGPAYDKLKSKLAEGMKRIKVGYGMDAGVTMGPVISAKHKERVLAYIEKGIQEGAELVVDGRGCKVDAYPNGHFVGPTLFANVTTNMTIGKEEIFGPVLSLVRAKDLAEAIAMANAHPYANASSIYTSNGASARAYAKEIDASMVGVNIGVPAPMSYFGFGGNKGSFYGDLKAHGRDQISFYTQNKTSIQRWW